MHNLSLLFRRDPKLGVRIVGETVTCDREHLFGRLTCRAHNIDVPEAMLVLVVYLREVSLNRIISRLNTTLFGR